MELHMKALLLFITISLLSSCQPVDVTKVKDKTPTAVIECDSIIVAGKEVVLDGRSSFSPDNSDIEFLWQMTGKAEKSNIILTI